MTTYLALGATLSLIKPSIDIALIKEYSDSKAKVQSVARSYFLNAQRHGFIYDQRCKMFLELLPDLDCGEYYWFLLDKVSFSVKNSHCELADNMPVFDAFLNGRIECNEMILRKIAISDNEELCNTLVLLLRRRLIHSKMPSGSFELLVKSQSARMLPDQFNSLLTKTQLK